MSFLAGKLCLVTGGSGTIGQAIAKVLLSEQASVILTARRLDLLEEAKRKLQADLGLEDNNGGPRVHVIPSDVSQEESILRLFETIGSLEGGKGLDLLVNNAGTLVSGTTESISAADMEYVLAVNVVGPFICAREAIKLMKKRGTGGRIINVASISSISPRPDSVTYTTSKFAIQGLSRSLALDCRPHGIAVGTIHPGNVVSSLLTPQAVAGRGEKEGFLQPQDVAECVLTMAKLPYTANVLDLTVIPTRQPLVGRG